MNERNGAAEENRDYNIRYKRVFLDGFKSEVRKTAIAFSTGLSIGKLATNVYHIPYEQYKGWYLFHFYGTQRGGIGLVLESDVHRLLPDNKDRSLYVIPVSLELIKEVSFDTMLPITVEPLNTVQGMHLLLWFENPDGILLDE